MKRGASPIKKERMNKEKISINKYNTTVDMILIYAIMVNFFLIWFALVMMIDFFFNIWGNSIKILKSV